MSTDEPPGSDAPRPQERAAVVVRIPEIWTLSLGTTNASGTEIEDFTLDVATKIKACGVRRVTVYMTMYGQYWRTFDGENPSRKQVGAWVKGQMAISAGL